MKKPRPGGGVVEDCSDDETSQRAQTSEVPGWGPFFETMGLQAASNELRQGVVIMGKSCGVGGKLSTHAQGERHSGRKKAGLERARLEVMAT
jgi:hypothetical protein